MPKSPCSSVEKYCDRISRCECMDIQLKRNRMIVNAIHILKFLLTYFPTYFTATNVLSDIFLLLLKLSKESQTKTANQIKYPS